MPTTDRRPVNDVLEGEAGCQYHQALMMSEAQAACEHAYENFRYDDEFPAGVLEAMRVVAEAEIKV